MNETAPPTLNIRLLGDFSLEHDGAPVTGISTPRLQSLLAYLLLHRDAPQSRAHLAFQFWPDSTDAQARSNLRTLLHRLRRALPDDGQYLSIDAQTVQWHPDAPASVDVMNFENALARAEDADEPTARQALEQAADLYSGDLLPSCYDDWILPHRERLRQAHLRALERLVQILEDRREYDAAIAHARAILRLDPLHEAATRRLMHLHTLKGDRTGALRAYHTCATALQRELGVEPSPATQRAHEQLLSLEDQARPAPRPDTGLTPLVGREAEWAQLQTAWRRTARGPRFVLLLGEAGIGKTRLVEELLHWAGRQNIDHAYARSYAAEGELAYAPVTTLLQARPLPALDDVWLTEVARLLPQVLAQRPDLPPPQPMTESWQRQRLFQALARSLLGGGSRRDPLLLVLDDLQWCDRESLEWLHYLLRFDPRAPLLVVSTCRPEELDEDCPLTQTLPTLHRDLRLTEIELGPLDEAGTAALASSVSGATLEATESQQLYTETEGNPLFVVEAMRGRLPASGSLLPFSGSGMPAKADPPSAEGLPLTPRVQAVLTTRLAQLSAPARQLAEVAATIGRGFTVALLKQASDSDEEDLAQGLDELWQRRIVRERGLDAYDFGHDKLREAAYSALKPARRRLLHHRVAQALESIHASELDPVSRQVAAHYRRAGLPAQAIPYYLRAGQVAGRIYAPQEALASFERGLALLQEGTWDNAQSEWYNQMAAHSQMAARCQEGRGDVLVQLGRPAEARLAYENALEVVDPRELIPPSRLHRKIGAIWWPLGEYRLAMDCLDRAEAALGPFPEMPEGGWTGAQIAWWVEWAKLLRRRVQVQYGAAELSELEQTVAKGEDALTRCALPLLRAAHLQGSLMARLRRERYLASAEVVDTALAGLAIFEEWGEPDMITTTEWGVGWALLLQGDLEGAEEHLQAGLALADRTRHLTNQAVLLTWLSVLHRKRGETEASREYALRGIPAATGAHLLENVGLARANLAWIALCEGDWPEAAKQAHAALELWEQSAFIYAFHWTALFPLLAMAVDSGAPAEALDHARALLHPQQQRLPELLEAALEATIQVGEEKGAGETRQHLERVVKIAKETGFL